MLSLNLCCIEQCSFLYTETAFYLHFFMFKLTYSLTHTLIYNFISTYTLTIENQVIFKMFSGHFVISLIGKKMIYCMLCNIFNFIV